MLSAAATHLFARVLRPNKALLLLLAGFAMVFSAGCGSSDGSTSTSAEPTVEVRRSAGSAREKSEARHAAHAAQQRRHERQQAKRHRVEQQEAREAEQQQTQAPVVEKGPPADWTSEEKQQFETNRVICASEPQEQLAGEYNVHDDAGSIAHAVGREFRLRQDMEIAAEEGCLEALVGR